jgi:hypothetical protein
LAELGEDGDLGQTLLTSYQHDAVGRRGWNNVFGLPAIKVGRKRGRTDDGDGFDRWRRERVDGIRADLARLPKKPVTRVLRKVRSMSAAYHTVPIQPNRDYEDGPRWTSRRPYLSPSLLDRLLAIRQELSGKQDGSRPFSPTIATCCSAKPFGDCVSMRSALAMTVRGTPRKSCIGSSCSARAMATRYGYSPLPPIGMRTVSLLFLPELKALQEALFDGFSEPSRRS